MRIHSKWAVTLVLMGLSAACSPTPSAPAASSLNRKEFVSLMKELHDKPKARAAILKKYDVSDADVRAYVRALAADPIALSEVLDTLQAQLNQEGIPGPKNFTPPPVE